MTFSHPEPTTYAPNSTVTTILRAWRIFGQARRFTDRPGGAELSWKSTISTGDELTVTVGDLPPQAVADIRAYASGSVDARAWLFSGGQPLPESHAALVKSSADEAELQVRDRLQTFLTVQVEREVLLPTDEQGRLQESVDLTSLKEFGDQAMVLLEEATGRLITSLGNDLSLGRLVYGRSARVFVHFPGRPPFALPEIEWTANVEVEGPGWVRLSAKPIVASMSGVGSKKSKAADLTADAVYWLSTSLAEGSDPLRSFLFAYLGLEVMTNRVAESLKTGPSASQRAQRVGINFRFEVIATQLSPVTAQDDVELFRKLTRKRHDTAHGNIRADAIEKLPTSKAIELLTRYIAVVYDGELQGLL